MKLSDFILDFPVTIMPDSKGICRVRIFLSQPSQVVVLLTDLEDYGTGPSVTNYIEIIYSTLTSRGLIPINCMIIEHYIKEGFSSSTFDVVSFNEDGYPNWSRLLEGEALNIIGCSKEELEEKISGNKRLVDNIERIKKSINPFYGSPYPEDPEIIRRRYEIADNMVSKKELLNLIENGAGEREIQEILKKDLSILGEMYAHPKDEYICFSEYPLDAGFVDFVVFTDRSRMNVIFIEVKGANFNTFSNNFYESFSKPMVDAIEQIRNRTRYTYDNQLLFRSEVHRVRSAVESGQKLYNSFVGPKLRLCVDEKKDVIIRKVIIGGRTVNDYAESRKRHMHEQDTSIKIESWDSWIRKMERR